LLLKAKEENINLKEPVYKVGISPSPPSLPPSLKRFYILFLLWSLSSVISGSSPCKHVNNVIVGFEIINISDATIWKFEDRFFFSSKTGFRSYQTNYIEIQLHWISNLNYILTPTGRAPCGTVRPVCEKKNSLNYMNTNQDNFHFRAPYLV